MISKENRLWILKAIFRLASPSERKNEKISFFENFSFFSFSYSPEQKALFQEIEKFSISWKRPFLWYIFQMKNEKFSFLKNSELKILKISEIAVLLRKSATVATFSKLFEKVIFVSITQKFSQKS